MAATKRTVASTSDSWGGSGGKGKGKRSRRNRDVEQERSDGVSVHTSGHWHQKLVVVDHVPTQFFSRSKLIPLFKRQINIKSKWYLTQGILVLLKLTEPCKLN